jgi:hypothetical protein
MYTNGNTLCTLPWTHQQEEEEEEEEEERRHSHRLVRNDTNLDAIDCLQPLTN